MTASFSDSPARQRFRVQLDRALADHAARHADPARHAGAARWLAAVSGGADSLLLLHWLAADPRCGEAFVLTAVHFEHGLQAEAAEGARLVQDACERLGIPLTVLGLPVRAAASFLRMTEEEAGHHLRRHALERLAAHGGFHALLTGHQDGDFLETFLFRLTRGHEPAGLAGHAGGATARLHLLAGLERDAVRREARAAGIAFWDDPTNAFPAHGRGRMRHGLLPHFRPLEQRGLLAARAALADEDAEWTAWFRAQFEKDGLGRWACLDLARLQHLPAPALRRAFLYAAGWARGGRAPSAAVVARLFDECARAPHPESRAVDLGGGAHAWREGARLRFVPCGALRLPPAADPDFSLALPDGRTLQVRRAGAGSLPHAPHAWTPADLPLRWRARRAGDALERHGRRRKLQDLFVDARVPRALRDLWPVLADPVTDAPLWVPGLAAAPRPDAAADGLWAAP